MTTHSQPPTRLLVRKASRNIYLTIYIVAFLLVAAAFMTWIKRDKQAKKDNEPTTALAQQETTAHEDLAERVRREAFVKLAEGQKAARDTLTEIEKLTHEIIRWQQEVKPLLTNDKGRSLSPHTSLVSKFLATYQQPRPTLVDAHEYRQQAEATRASIVKRIQDKSSTAGPSPTEQRQLATITNSAQSDLEVVRAHRLAIEAILAQAPEPSPNAITLEEAIMNLRHQRALDEARKTEERVQVELDAAAERRADAEAERVRAEKLLEEQKIQNETRKLEQQQEDLRLYPIAHDKQALQILAEIITPANGPTNFYAWQVHRMGPAYASEATFNREYKDALKRVHRNGADQAWIQKSDKANEFYDMTLWELFKVVADYNRDVFMTLEQTRRIYAEESAAMSSSTSPTRKRAVSHLKSARNPRGAPLPPPKTLPPTNKPSASK